MSVLKRSKTSGSPIRIFLEIPSQDTLDAVNAFVWDTNKYLSGYVAGLPANVGTGAALALVLTSEGQTGFATNGCKVGEASGAGTGVEVYFSLGQLRVKSTDAPLRT